MRGEGSYTDLGFIYFPVFRLASAVSLLPCLAPGLVEEAAWHAGSWGANGISKQEGVLIKHAGSLGCGGGWHALGGLAHPGGVAHAGGWHALVRGWHPGFRQAARRNQTNVFRPLKSCCVLHFGWHEAALGGWLGEPDHRDKGSSFGAPLVPGSSLGTWGGTSAHSQLLAWAAPGVPGDNVPPRQWLLLVSPGMISHLSSGCSLCPRG